MGGKQDRQFLTVDYVLHWLYLRLRNVSLQLTGVILLTDLQLNSIAYFEHAQSAQRWSSYVLQGRAPAQRPMNHVLNESSAL